MNVHLVVQDPAGAHRLTPPRKPDLLTDPESVHRRVDELLTRRRPADPPGVVGALDGLCRTVRDDLDLVGATVSLIPSIGTHTVCAASSPAARRLDEAQFNVGEGPARDAFVARRPVLAADLENTHAQRWPGWIPAALADGVTGVYSFPLHVGAAIFGVLTLYAGERALDQERMITATAFAELATEILLDGTLPGGDSQWEPDLGRTLERHAYVYQAQGMVMVALGVTLAEALAIMRAHAWANGDDLTELAGEIVAGQLMPSRDIS